METIVNRLIFLSQNSQLNHKHAACILKGKKIISSSCNCSRSYLRGRVCCSGHAEQMAILNFFGANLTWKGRKWIYRGEDNRMLRKYKLMVIRVSGKSNKLVNSTPCQDCVKLMRFTKLGQVMFSMENDIIAVIRDFNDIPIHHSISQRHMLIK